MSIETLRAEARELIERADEDQLLMFVESFGTDDEEPSADELAETEAIREKHLRGEGVSYSLEETLDHMKNPARSAKA